MSNIGKKPIIVPEGVQIERQKDWIKVTGANGTLEMRIPSGITVEQEGGKIVVKQEKERRDLKKVFGLTRALLANMLHGVRFGFEKKLELVGVGFRGKVEGTKLLLNVGFATPVTIQPSEGVAIAVHENIITVSGANKETVGDVASKIRSVKPPDPYKGKGIRYVGEKIRKKAGKAAKAAGAK